MCVGGNLLKKIMCFTHAHIYMYNIERDKIIFQYIFDKTCKICTHDGCILRYNIDWQSYRPHRTYIHTRIRAIVNRIIGIGKGPLSIGFRQPHRHICFLFTPPLRNCCGMIFPDICVCVHMCICACVRFLNGIFCWTLCAGINAEPPRRVLYIIYITTLPIIIIFV